ncbi:hypothetical protein FGADI_4570 [Fusarium gaditjirri]|uniref:Uncharacterized protein n=1 Tax=Fusarium gaditjirri TaxID=282569 RepID=A0A8H4TCN2_9HYPO|nr:hypothetical protein FGADI_4570 [Fusarium gaditjirri]
MDGYFWPAYLDYSVPAYFPGEENPYFSLFDFIEGQAADAVNAEASSQDNMAPPRSPSLYGMPAFSPLNILPHLNGDIPPRINIDALDIKFPENEANPVVKAEPSSPHTVAAPESPPSPALRDIPRFFAAPVFPPPHPAPEDMERPIPSRQPSPRTSPHRDLLRSHVNEHGMRRNLQFFINRGSQRRAITQAQLARRHRMQQQQFEARRHQRHVDALQCQHEQRLRDAENVDCNSVPVSRKRRYHNAARYVERFSVRDEEERGRLSPYDLY